MAAPSARPVEPAPSYGGLYGGLAFVVIALTGGRIYVDPEAVPSTYPTLWEMLSTRGAVLGAGALLIVAGIVLLSAIAVVRGVRSIPIPIAVAALALLAAVMLMARVGSSQAPDLATAGGMMLVTCWAAVGLGIVHAIHVSRWRSRAPR